MIEVTLEGNSIVMGNFSLMFERTLRIPDDGNEYPLPPGLGAFPVLKVEDYSKSVPDSWRERCGFFIPMYQREAMWLPKSVVWDSMM